MNAPEKKRRSLSWLYDVTFRDFFLACGNIAVANCTIDLISRGAFIVKRSDASGSIRLSAC